MIAMLMRQPQQQNNMGSQPRRQQQQQQGQQRRGGAGGPQDIENTRQNILANPGAMQKIRDERPALADAIHDPDRFREVWQQMMQDDEDRERDRQEQMRLLNEDPFNIEAQQKIEEMIREESVQENLQFAYEHNPEGESTCQGKWSYANDAIYSVWKSDNALHPRRSQQAPGQGFRRLWSADHHHVAFVCRGLRYHEADRQALRWHCQRCRYR